MKNPVVIIGMGELGGFFAPGFLKSGYPVVPVLRGMALASVSSELPNPELVLVAVGESELHPLLESIAPGFGLCAGGRC